MLIRIPIDRLDEHGADRPPSFLVAVRATAKLENDHWLIESDLWNQLVKEHALPHSERPDITIPSIIELKTDYAKATQNWILRGRKVITETEYVLRASICSDCVWCEERNGRQRCEHPKRVCSRLLAWASWETCMLAKWPKASLFLDSSNSIITAENKIPMPNKTITEQLNSRKTALLKLVNNMDNAVSLTESRLSQLKQRRDGAKGELKAISELLASQNKPTELIDPKQ